jgi:polysaccharide pyruvyl transferase WcaK-like protein
MEHLRRFDAVVGPRFHGVMLGIQAGVPGVVVTHDSRTRELAATTFLPHIGHARVEADGESALWEALGRFDADAFDANRRGLAGSYVGALKAHGLEVSPLLGRLCG